MLRTANTLVLVSSALLAGPLVAGVRVVDGAQGPGAPYATVQSAVNAAAPGDLVLIRAGDLRGRTGLGCPTRRGTRSGPRDAARS